MQSVIFLMKNMKNHCLLAKYQLDQVFHYDFIVESYGCYTPLHNLLHVTPKLASSISFH